MLYGRNTKNEETKELMDKCKNFESDLDDEKERHEEDNLQKLRTLDEKHRYIN